MIVTPLKWQDVGRPISLKKIEGALCEILKEIDCKNLALSGGVDSSLLLALMVKVFGNQYIQCFNIAQKSEHPDYIYSEMAARHFKVGIQHFILSDLELKQNDYSGDEIVRGFYGWFRDLGKISIVAGDGIDEYNCGYYDHLHNPTEETYYSYIRKLQKEQLVPLDMNSIGVNVHLPYIFDEIIFFWSQIPLSEKVDELNRKKIVCQLAERNNIPEEIIYRRKYGFCDAMRIKK